LAGTGTKVYNLRKKTYKIKTKIAKYRNHFRCFVINHFSNSPDFSNRSLIVQILLQIKLLPLRKKLSLADLQLKQLLFEVVRRRQLKSSKVDRHLFSKGQSSNQSLPSSKKTEQCQRFFFSQVSRGCSKSTKW